MRRKKVRYRVLNYKKVTVAVIILILFNISIIYGIVNLVKNITHSTSAEVQKAEEKQEIEIPKDTNINFVAIGDIMCHDTNYKAAYDSNTKTYDFSPVFKNVAKYISEADISIGNLETTFAGKDRGYSGYPTFNSPEELGTAIKDIGVDILSTANNHSMDKGTKGIINTLDTLDKIGIDHTGTYRSKEEQNTILVKDVKGIKIAFLSFTYGTNGIPVPKDKEYIINLIDKNLIKEQIELAKEENVDLICASMHWGNEYAQKQSKEQEKLADFLFENGVDIIIGNHAHVIEPMEKRTITLEDGTKKDVFVIYALGNFVSGQRKEHTKSTVILNIEITKNGQTGKVSLGKIDYVPVYCYDKGSDAGKNRYELLDVRKEMKLYEENSNTSKSLYKILKNELANTEKVLGEPIE